MYTITTETYDTLQKAEAILASRGLDDECGAPTGMHEDAMRDVRKATPGLMRGAASSRYYTDVDWTKCAFAIQPTRGGYWTVVFVD